jgi:hypothetical protein
MQRLVLVVMVALRTLHETAVKGCGTLAEVTSG